VYDAFFVSLVPARELCMDPDVADEIPVTSLAEIFVLVVSSWAILPEE
jgi:hypothetical protein